MGLVLTVLIIGLAPVFIKVGLHFAPVEDQLAHRFGIAAISLVLIFLLSGKGWPRYERKEVPGLLLLTLFYPLLFFSMQAIGIQYTTASEAGIISATTPLFTLILARLFLGERNSLLQIGAMLLSVIGVAYIMYKNGLEMSSDTLKGDFFILLSALSMSLYFLFARRINMGSSPINTTFFIIIVGAIALNLYAFGKHAIGGTLESFWAPLLKKDYLLTILFLGVLSSALSSFLNNNALSQLSASKVSVFNNLSPIVSVFSGVLILSETLGTHHIIGTILVLAGVFGMNFYKAK